MARVFTTKPGEVLRIGVFGEASNDQPAIVPQTVVDELSGSDWLRIEPALPGDSVVKVVLNEFTTKRSRSAPAGEAKED